MFGMSHVKHLVLGLLFLLGMTLAASAQTNIEALPSIGTEGSQYPLPDPALVTSDLDRKSVV